MRKTLRVAAAGAAMIGMAMTAQPAAAMDATTAEKLRKLDIMLMVTALRCRHGTNGFQADYNQFSANNLTHLNAASRKLQADLRSRYGSKGAKRALDRISVGMANTYGNGHPSLGCAELKDKARALSGRNDQAVLVAAADELLDSRVEVKLAAGQ